MLETPGSATAEPHAAVTEACAPRGCALQQEQTLQWATAEPHAAVPEARGPRGYAMQQEQTPQGATAEPHAAVTEARGPRGCALQQEQTPQWGAGAGKSSPGSPQLEKAPEQQKRPSRVKNIKRKNV